MIQLIPKDTAFFDLFERAARNVHEGAVQVLEFIEKLGTESASEREERAKRIKDVEHAGDDLTHETINRLNKTFITPLDREDIHELVGRLDDILDLMDTAVSRMVLYKVDKPTEDAKALARCVRHATGLLVEVMPLLRNMKDSQKILQTCKNIHIQENEADKIERHALASLFDEAHDAIYIIKWKDIYGDLEIATDRCEDVANVLEGIVLKNG